jgi:NADH-quinone oxidoreductase subunit E
MQHQLAGFADEREGAVGDGPAGMPTLRGVTLAQQAGVAVANFNPDTPINRTKPAREQKTSATNPAEAAGVAANKPASDAKPAGDSRGNEVKK